MFLGDLTDAKTPNRLGSLQHLEEWEKYKSILHNTKAVNKTTWLDVRGNHGKSPRINKQGDISICILVDIFKILFPQRQKFHSLLNDLKIYLYEQ